MRADIYLIQRNRRLSSGFVHDAIHKYRNLLALVEGDGIMSGTTVSITKIQLRRGNASDLPGAPTSVSPLLFATGLDEGELGYTTDTGRLFIGIGQDTPT